MLRSWCRKRKSQGIIRVSWVHPLGECKHFVCITVMAIHQIIVEIFQSVVDWQTLALLKWLNFLSVDSWINQLIIWVLEEMLIKWMTALKEKKPHTGYWTWMYQHEWRQLFVFHISWTFTSTHLFPHVHSHFPWTSGGGQDVLQWPTCRPPGTPRWITSPGATATLKSLHPPSCLLSCSWEPLLTF